MTATVDALPSEIERWAVVELLGHNQCAGLASVVEVAGSKMLRVCIPRTPTEDNPDLYRVVHFTPSAIYAVHFCTETKARLANNARPYEAQHDADIEDFLEKITDRLTQANGRMAERSREERERDQQKALVDAIEPVICREVVNANVL